MAELSDTLKILKSAQLNFISQNLDIVHLALDKIMLSSRPYLQPYSVTLDAGADNGEAKTDVPNGEIWILSKIEHRDVEPGIFDVRFKLDDIDLFPETRLESAYFLIELSKAFITRKHFKVKVTNQDTVSKTYRHLRTWHIYDRIAVNTFLNTVLPGVVIK